LQVLDMPAANMKTGEQEEQMHMYQKTGSVFEIQVEVSRLIAAQLDFVRFVQESLEREWKKAIEADEAAK
jgi:hypothetical protein